MRKQFRKLWIKPSGQRVVEIANWDRTRPRRELGKENWRQPARVHNSHQNFVVREGKGYKR